MSWKARFRRQKETLPGGRNTCPEPKDTDGVTIQAPIAHRPPTNRAALPVGEKRPDVVCSVNCLSGFSHGSNRYDAAVAVSAVEGNNAVFERIERVVLAHADILAGIVNRTALTDDDVTGDALLTAPDLNA